MNGDESSLGVLQQEKKGKEEGPEEEKKKIDHDQEDRIG